MPAQAGTSRCISAREQTETPGLHRVCLPGTIRLDTRLRGCDALWQGIPPRPLLIQYTPLPGNLLECVMFSSRLRLFPSFAIIIAAVAAALISTPRAALAQDLMITGGKLFDSVSDELRPNSGIIIRSGKIMAVDAAPEDADKYIAERPMHVIELDDDQTIMPGIFDLHAHYNMRIAGTRRQEWTDYYPQIYLANGCTSTFPAGEYFPDRMMEMRRRIEQGEQIGPRIYASGPYYGLSMRRRANEQEVYDRVDEWAAKGARGFKAKAINTLQLQALIDRAHRYGLTVTAHLDSGFRGSVNPKTAILMGIDRIEHFLGGDLLPDSRSAYASLRELTDEDLESDAFTEIVNLYIEHGVFFDATLTAYGYFGGPEDVYEHWHDESQYFTPYVQQHAKSNPQQVMQQFIDIYHVKKKTLKRFCDMGGSHLLTLGTDHVSSGEYLAGFAAHREMHAWVTAGLKPAVALKAATINGARAMNVANKLGTIEPGKLADIIIIDGDPIEDIRNTRKVQFVIKNGTPYNPRDLLADVVGKIGPGDAEEDKADAP